ncbi:UDP-N-acetylglucosamine--N-acetylmuramyl-(pentapeptide) pyrophosphoryl-undecaprenol N-acetylglucosamine transferase [Pontixanthobacter aestiaquae]|uniref:UDP-N-acetylglucosamine--N-acetylmuramyl-(pentapeptide) pyrophosphoryl-undecaprenol N-acetylglucosamine transferase n=1 Tax=Pontixanthobacter aestiaquae TaxID=1509367 RepID=A0A844ZAW3_9SPHN|nr:UDP-N-acetylglucosamine--N-acetylmuramyl-(pentapeptide) pyrophosphoryl-undecaprenol N-acetylglucosamine transferase [Pontixanthobacter aestiaquae]MDN3646018.1 UDP-N-acetylglucosamine--N-acetylmuramyl-(pentapeptide) pyrophosphoryl-undecaprenol N-acetylglucosamine transferase [Pontixanthobacter aestiaquae]MXO82989.1 UDP-N-acetylglucosamine--N-acetylmuramyl-(pentapeptide) pyrophosphoryl-undecaprenol N-acetylglucosamine transferase [Pontixanthobacter aestiaquae]
MSGANKHYVLAAGGTGGHLIPAFALATELERRGHHVALITDERGANIPGKPDFLPAHVLPAGRFGKNPLNWIKGFRAVMEGRKMALRLFESFGPSAVIGFGGYPALPALLASTSAEIPSLVHEQNAVLGRVNRLLAGRVQAIATAYPEIKRLKDKYSGKVHLVGNPVRPEVLQLRDEPFPAFTEDGLLRILVIGGSQGARILSEVIPDALSMLQPALRSRLQVTQQCRPEDLDAVREKYKQYDIPAELGTYFEDMAARLADAHLFIGRAGASSIAELTAAGRPAILLPLPIATDDHQTANTLEMTRSGGARAIRQPMMTVKNPDDYGETKGNKIRVAQADILQRLAKDICKQIQALAQRPETLATAAHAAWNCGRPDAVKDLADLMESFGGADMMDVIRVGADKTSGAKQTAHVPTGATKDVAE